MQRVPGPKGQDQNLVKGVEPPGANAFVLAHKRQLMHDIGRFILLARDFIADATEIRARLMAEIAEAEVRHEA